MEINHQNFQRLCLLPKEGYSINGRNNDGVILINTNQTKDSATVDLRKICGKCGCHTEGNCNPEAEDTDHAEIYAKIA